MDNKYLKNITICLTGEYLEDSISSFDKNKNASVA